MTSGKAAIIAGHAFLNSFIVAYTDYVSLAEEYLEPNQIKVVLGVDDELSLHNLYAMARKAGLPCAFVHERPWWDGKKTEREEIVALGLGPATRKQLAPIVGSLKLINQIRGEAIAA